MRGEAYNTAWCLAALLVSVLLGGCRPGAEYVVARLDVAHAGWDTLRVEADFERHPLVGLAQQVRPERLTVVAFDAAYDTLYAGPGPLVAVPDTALGSRERIMVEVCGQFGGQSVCEQSGVAASPKRLSVHEEVTYPERGNLARGRYAFDFDVERQRFDGRGWEPIAWTGDVEGYLLASIHGSEAAPVRIPFNRSEGRFDLAGHAGYRDFRYDLDNRMLDEENVQVRFDVYASLGDGTEQLTAVEKHIRPKTRAERTYDVAMLAEQAATQLMTTLEIENPRRVRAYIDRWTYDKLQRRYTIEMEVQWGGTSFGAGRYRLTGTLEVGENGRDGAFEMRSGNRRARHLWQAAHRGESLALRPMEVEVEEAIDATTQPSMTVW